MRKQFWLALQDEAPAAVSLCLHHFQDRYTGHWAAKLLDARAVITYLETRGVGLTVTTFGVPSRHDWYYELMVAGELREHRRDFPAYERAAEAGIRAAFLELEKDLSEKQGH